MTNMETIASEVLSASIGGAISASFLYPLEVVKTKMQASTSHVSDHLNDSCMNDKSTNETAVVPKPLSMISLMRELYKTEGLAVFWRGVEASAFQSALEKALYFFAYTVLKNSYLQVQRQYFSNNGLNTMTNLALGCAAEWAHLPITLPVDTWMKRVQTQSGPVQQAPMAVLLSMLSDKNVRFYKGLQAYWLLCLKPALQYTVYEKGKAWLIQHRKNKVLGAAEAFILGMIARTVSTVIVFPFLRAKVLLQTASNTSSGGAMRLAANDDSILSLLLHLLRHDGLAAGWYQGLGPELTRGVLSAALMLMIKEKVAGAVQATFLQPDMSTPSTTRHQTQPNKQIECTPCSPVDPPFSQNFHKQNETRFNYSQNIRPCRQVTQQQIISAVSPVSPLSPPPLAAEYQ